MGPAVWLTKIAAQTTRRRPSNKPTKKLTKEPTKNTKLQNGQLSRQKMTLQVMPKNA